jgi:hypothetical protein
MCLTFSQFVREREQKQLTPTESAKIANLKKILHEDGRDFLKICSPCTDIQNATCGYKGKYCCSCKLIP